MPSRASPTAPRARRHSGTRTARSCGFQRQTAARSVLDRLGARVDHAFQSLQRQAAPPSKSLYIAAFALSPQGDTPPELVGEYFWLAFPRFYFGLSEAERAPFARYAGAMLERFLRRAQNKEDLRHVALALHRLHFSKNNNT